MDWYASCISWLATHAWWLAFVHYLALFALLRYLAFVHWLPSCTTWYLYLVSLPGISVLLCAFAGAHTAQILFTLLLGTFRYIALNPYSLWFDPVQDTYYLQNKAFQYL